MHGACLSATTPSTIRHTASKAGLDRIDASLSADTFAIITRTHATSAFNTDYDYRLPISFHAAFMPHASTAMSARRFLAATHDFSPLQRVCYFQAYQYHGTPFSGRAL